MTEQTEDGHALGALRALVRDVEGVCPIASLNLWEELDSWPAEWKDKTLYFAMVDLPKIGKWLDKSLSSLTADPRLIEPNSIGPIIGYGRVKFIPILDSLFWEHGGIVGALQATNWELDPNLVLMARQFLYMFKNYAKPCPRDRVVGAVREFWEVDANLRPPRSVDTDLFFHACGGAYADGVSFFTTKTLRRLVSTMDTLAARLAPGADLDVNDLLPGHGPGAVSDLSSSGDKYTFPDYPQTIEETMPADYFCSPNWRLAEFRPIVSRKTPAKLVAVPKTYEKPRLIASEPVVHQFLQQGLMKWIRGNMHPIHKVMIDFVDQEPSRVAALAASRSGDLATIDLSAASDRLSTWVVESHFSTRPFLLDALLRTRSSHIHDPIWSGETREIRKFAPMGSAVTFPVQSLVYATAALAAGIVWEGRDKRPISQRSLAHMAKRIRVFGDDIICPREHVAYLGLLFEYLQLKVNSRKSHVSGRFRESCGMDAYRGFDVTPAYISHQAPSSQGGTLVAYVEQSNNAHRKGFWSLAAWMSDQVEHSHAGLVPTSDKSLGCCTFFTFVHGTLANHWRWSKPHQVWLVQGYALRTSTKTKARNSYLSLLQFYLESPDPQSKWVSGHSGRPRPELKVVTVNSQVERPLRRLPRRDLRV